MKKTFCLFICLFSLLTVTGQAENLNFTSYYPAPAGNYQSIHLTPQAARPSSNCNIGTLYVNSDDNNLLNFCSPNELGIATFAPIAGPWTLNTNNLYLTDTTNSENKKIGIGTTTPTFKLTIENDGGILTDGPAASSSALPISGTGTRLMWYPAKGAFRAGYVAATEWDDANIGISSMTMGYGNTAAGQGATVWGGQNNSASNASSAPQFTAPIITGGQNNTTNSGSSQILGGSNNINNEFNNINQGLGSRIYGKANKINSGNYSIVGGGENNISSGNGGNTIAGGFNNIIASVATTISGGGQNTIPISANYSTISGGGQNVITGASASSTIAGGYTNSINGAENAAISAGSSNITSGYFSIISGGQSNTASGPYSTIAGGKNNTTNCVTGYCSISGGFANTVSGNYSTILGGNTNTASGNYSIGVGGTNNIVAGNYSLAAGRFMNVTGDNTFVWGHANSSISPITTTNAMIIYSGSVSIRDTWPSALLEINGNASTDDYLNLTSTSAATAGNILTIKSNGRLIGVGQTNPAYPLHFSNGAYVDTSGNFMPASSRAYKKNIANLNLSQAQDAFAKLAPVQYNYKNETDHRYVGFIAEDVPDLVAEKDRQGLAPMDITAVLTKIITHQQDTLKEQQIQTDNLLKEVAELKNILHARDKPR